jgi:PAS domain-containing protein
MNDRALLSSFAIRLPSPYRMRILYRIRAKPPARQCIARLRRDGILILGPDISIERCNPAAERLLLQPASEVQGKQHAEVIRWEIPPKG